MSEIREAAGRSEGAVMQLTWRTALSRRRFLQAMGLGVTAAVLGGCAATEAPTKAPTQIAAPSGEPSTGGGNRTIRLANSVSQGLFEPPQPFTLRTGPAYVQMSLLFDSLVWRDSGMEPIPWLAEDWTSSADGTEWSFTLRDGLKFHDGQPLTARDVAFAYKYVAKWAGSFFSTVGDVLQEATAPDERTAKITLKGPYAPFLSGVAAQIPILPEHMWSTVEDPLKFTAKEAFIGSGAYSLEQMSETERSFLFTASPSFFLGQPYVQRLEFISVGDELVALKAGQIDMANPTVMEGLPKDVIASFRADPKYAVVEAPGEGTTALHFNLAKGVPYDDVRFRQAIVYGINRRELVDRVVGGTGDIGSAGFLSPGNPYTSKNVEPYEYDVERARVLLDDAGCKLVDGRRQRPDGTPLVLSLLFGSSLVRVAEYVRGQLALLGITVELKSADQGTANQLQSAGNYEVSLVTYGGLGGDPDFLRRAFSSPEQAKFWWKAWGYSNPDLNRMAAEQMKAIDGGERRAIVEKMQQTVAKDVPVMPLYYPIRFLIYDPTVFDGWYFTPVWTPLPTNKHAFITGQKTGLAIRQQ
ncbi:MAG: ABC transporter substrate-binding protein [Chloroflexota bacterium]